MTVLTDTLVLKGQFIDPDPIDNKIFFTFNSNKQLDHQKSLLTDEEKNNEKSEQIKSQIQKLCQLPEGWDGEYAQPVSREAANKAAYITYATAKDYIELVQFFPLAAGGMQIELFVGGNQLEIEIDENGNAFVVSVDDSGDVKFEGEFQLRDHDMIEKIAQEIRKLAVMVL